jgi:hypothetical protein
MPTVGGKRETIEYRNAAGQKLFIPFINGQPIYPIPEGYRRYIEEQQTQTEQVPVTGTTTQVTGDGDSDVLSQTSQVTNIQDPDITDNQRAGVVMSALDKATDKGKLGKALGVIGTSMVPGVGLLGALGADRAGFDPMAPDRSALDDVLGQFGYDAKSANAALNDPMASVGFTQQQAIDMANSVTQTELSSNTMQEAIAQAMYGMSKAQATSMLGVAPNTTLGIKGYKNGQVDPTTMGTYAFGQSTDDDGNVAYGSINDFGIAMSASAKTGFMGGLKDAERVSKTGKTEKARQRAKDYITEVKEKNRIKEQPKEFDRMRDDSRTDDEVAADLDAISQEAAQDPQTQAEMGFTDMTAFGGSEADTGTGVDGTGMGGGGEDPSGPDSDSGQEDAIYKGSLITKRKASGKLKKKYMKRGGLASKK